MQHVSGHIRLILPMLFCICSAGAAAAGRFALMIGNANYDQPLVNPINDARAMASRLQALGYDVTLQTDLKREPLLNQVSQFAQRAQNADIALVFYAGHGAQGGDSNYLIPVDLPTRTLSRQSLQRGGYDINLILAELQRNKVQAGLLVIDACRVVYQRGDTANLAIQGMKQLSTPKGYIVAYSTSPGGRASDYWSRDSKNSPYTHTLLDELARPAQSIESLLKNVGTRVAKLTQYTQVPWYSSSLTGSALQLNSGKQLAAVMAPKSFSPGGARGALVWDTNRLYDWAIEIQTQKQNPYLDRNALKLRAQGGDVVAQTSWAMLNQPDKVRKTWLKKAASQNFPIAQMYLGEWYSDNERTPEGRIEAERLLKLAAGYFPPASATLAQLYLQQSGKDAAQTGIDELTKAAKGYVEYLRHQSVDPKTIRSGASQ